MPNINETVPEFTAQNQNNESISNQNLLGSKYILLFYGQNDTPTCTKQVCMASSVAAQAAAMGYSIYGVSPDSVARHQKFIQKHQLQINLLADPSKQMMYAFDAYGPKVFMGKQVTGVYRKCYVVNESGIIVGKIDEVRAATQGEQIMAELAKL
jgi:thioredoxin-dependent peroxiredoxin